MIGMLKRDLIIMFSSKRELLFLVLYIPFLIFALDSSNPEWLYINILYAMTYLKTITPFSYDVSYKTRYMINSLPISRKEMVLYKYLLTFVYFLMSIVYVGVYLWIINTLGIVIVDYFNLEMIKMVLPKILFSIAIAFPAFIRFNSRVAYIVNIAIFVVMINIIYNFGGTSLITKLGILSNGNYILPISIVLYLLSLLLSMRLYETRDL